MWTSQSAMELQVPAPTIDIAVAMRDLSVLVKERAQASTLINRPISILIKDHDSLIKQLQEALFISLIIVYAQGMALLKVASEKYDYKLDLESVAKIWRGGCIIRAQLLDDIFAAFHQNKNLTNLLLDPNLSQKINTCDESLREIVCQASRIGIPIPAFMATLSYLDAYRSSWQPANLIQAQRDYFGAHTYERTDIEGTFHTEWEKNNSLNSKEDKAN